MDITSSNTQANDSNPLSGVVFTSTNPLAGYPYLQARNEEHPSSLGPPDLRRTTPSSMLTRAMARDAASPKSMERTASAASSGGSDTTMSSTKEEGKRGSDAEVFSSGSSYSFSQNTPRRHASASVYVSLAESTILKTTLKSPFTSPPMTLIVGGRPSPSRENEPIPFFAHKELLVNLSPFFRAAFGHSSEGGRNKFQEAEDGVMRLPEERPEDIAYLLQWCYWRSSCRHNQSGEEETVQREGAIAETRGLWHASIDIPLHHFREFRERRKQDKAAVRQIGFADTAAKNTSGTNVIPPGTVDSISTSSSSPADIHLTNGTVEDIAAPTLPTTASTIASFYPSAHLRRPPPPAFGPLIRLYILADKYCLPVELKRDICLRVKEVGRMGRCVPDEADVALLWDSRLVHWEGDHHNPDRDAEEDLKDILLEMFANLNPKSFRGIFYPSSSSSSAAAAGCSNTESSRTTRETETRDADISASGSGSENCGRRFVGEGNGEGEGEEAWHPVFMKSLLSKMYCKVHTLESCGPGKLGSTGNGAQGGPRGFVGSEGVDCLEEVGRVRRKRFPSLSGLAMRRGEEAMCAG